MQNLIGSVDVSRETFERLKTFEALILKWSPKINLVSRDARTHIWQRHILDSAQLFDHRLPSHGAWVDIGSGGGLPGVVAAILLAERAPEMSLVMIESDQRKATFLRTALRECDVEGVVIAERIESAPPQIASIMSARALAPITELLPHAMRHLSENGIALLHKGRNYAKEIKEAELHWSFDVETHPSLTADDSRILEIRNIRRANPDEP